MAGTFEKSLWRYVRNGMGKTWNATRHTDKLIPGIPDVSFGLDGINGWIELKTLVSWPKRKTTPIRLEHFTIEQRHFLAGRGATGGHCFLLLRVGRAEHLLIPWDKIPLLIDAPGVPFTRFEWETVAVGHWKRGIDFNEFRRLLCSK